MTLNSTVLVLSAPDSEACDRNPVTVNWSGFGEKRQAVGTLSV